ncbi:MAG: hypothetical protein ACFFD4_11660 [Candidatus Odinarchaeota archaeon]
MKVLPAEKAMLLEIGGGVVLLAGALPLARRKTLTACTTFFQVVID